MFWVGHFGIVDGQAQQASPWVSVFPESARGEPEEASDLFVVVEPAAPGSEDYCRDLSQAIGSRFRQRRLSLTGGILRALKAAHEDLRDWNRRSLKEHRVAAGASCLALRPGGQASPPGGPAASAGEAYLGLAGPSAAVVLQDGSLQRLRPRLPESIEPLGLDHDFWPDFSRHELREGGRLLLLTSALDASLSDAELMQALTPPPEETLPYLYAKAKEQANAAAVLVAALPEAPA